MADQERLNFREQTGGCHDPGEREALRAIQAMYPRTRWDEVRDDDLATQDPKAEGAAP